MTLKDYEKNIIETEENILEDVLTTIRDSNKNFSERLENEQKRATELTKELVNAKNDEDKQLLASDESVSHSLVAKKLEQIDILTKQYEKPYFADPATV